MNILALDLTKFMCFYVDKDERYGFIGFSNKCI